MAPALREAAQRGYRGRAQARSVPFRLSAAAALAAALLAPASALGAGTGTDAVTPTTTNPTTTSPEVTTAVTNPYDVTTEVAIASAVHPVYTAASTRATKLGSLVLYTPDGEALQTYELLAAKTVRGVHWEQIAVPKRPNGQTGWVKRSWLGTPIVSHTLMVVNRAARTLTVYKDGTAVLTTPVGVGKPSSPTPAGHFWIAESFSSSNPFYGPWAFGTTDYSVLTDWPGGGIVGVHGTNEPGIPGAISHGCVRVPNANVLKLKKIVSIGTAIWIE